MSQNNLKITSSDIQPNKPIEPPCGIASKRFIRNLGYSLAS